MSAHDWTVPESDVLSRARSVLADGIDAVLATVIDVEGSAYRRPGAKMVVTAEGEGHGHVTAGCLEDEVFELAADVLEAGGPRIETYDLMADDDVWGLGIGCNGIIDLLVEPLDDQYRPALEAVRDRERIARVTPIDEGVVGESRYYRPDAGFEGDVVEDVQTAEDRIANLVAAGKSGTIDVGDRDAFVDTLVPPDRAVVVGSGNDVRPVVELATEAGFEVTLVGFRGGNVSSERFPAADELVATSPASLTDAGEIDEDTYAVVMTHNFVDDRLAVESLLETEVPYVGLLGPRERFEEMREAFAEEGTDFSADQLDRLYTPAGLDLGGGDPYQIALSITSELLAVANDREPRHLRDREGPIHERIEEV